MKQAKCRSFGRDDTYLGPMDPAIAIPYVYFTRSRIEVFNMMDHMFWMIGVLRVMIRVFSDIKLPAIRYLQVRGNTM